MTALKIFIISMIPVLEQKAAIPMGIIGGMNKFEVLLITTVGALVPSLFIMYGVKFIFPYLRKMKYIGDIILKIEKRAMSKGDQILKYELIGLCIFVGIPLPGTGVWTGSLIAGLLEMDIKKSFVAISIGALISGTLLMFGTDIIVNLVKWIF